jgi:hypothetical protein
MTLVEVMTALLLLAYLAALSALVIRGTRPSVGTAQSAAVARSCAIAARDVQPQPLLTGSSQVLCLPDGRVVGTIRGAQP